MKKIATGLMAAVLCVGMHPVGQALEYGTDIAPSSSYVQQFSDVPTNHWAFSYIAELSNRGAINGFVDGKYYPNNTVTRAQFAKIMTVAAGLTPKAGSSTAFADVPASHWSAPYVAIAQSYMTYYQQNGQYVFQPNAAALREDIAFAVVRMKGYDISMADEGALEVMFSDYASISEALRPYVAVAVEKGVISGYPDGTFRAQNIVTRAEAATILWRAFQLGSDNKVVNGNDTNTQQPTATQPTTQKPTVTQPTQQEQKPTVTQSTEQKPQQPTTTEPTQKEPQQSVEDEPAPEPVVQKKGKVQMVNSLPKNVKQYVMTKNGDLYYIKDNQLFVCSNGNSEQIFDGNSDFYEDCTASEMLSNWSDDSNDIIGGYDEEQALYFETLSLQVGYDAKNDAVYVLGITNTQTIEGANMDWDVKNRYIFAVDDMKTPIYSKPVKQWGGYSFAETTLICGEDLLVISIGEHYAYHDTYHYKVDLNSGNEIKYENTFNPYDTYLQIDSDLIRIGNNKLDRLDLSSSSWQSINLKDRMSADAFCSYQNQIYYANGTGLYRLEPAGTNRMQSVAVLTWDEVSIEDGAPIGSISKMLFDQDGNILLFDSKQNWVRKLVLQE